jgi:preprotein translocase subunit SecG
MVALLVALHVLVSLFLIFVILLQPGKGDGMGSAFGGGGSSSVFGSRGSVTFLAKVTEVCAVIFMVTSLTLAYRSSHSSSVIAARHRLAEQEAAKKAEDAAKKAAPQGVGTSPSAPAPTDGAAKPADKPAAPAPAPTAPAPNKPK